MKQNKLDQVDFYKHIINSIEGSIYWKDLNGVYLGCNLYAAKMVGLAKPEDIIGKTDFDLFSREIANQYKKHDKHVITYETEISIEEQGVAVDGSILYQLSSKKPLYDSQGDLIGIIGNTINVTDRKKAQMLELENQRLYNEKEILAKGGKLLKDVLLLIEQYKIDELDKKNISRPLRESCYMEEIKLSRREKQILYYLAMGKSTKEIATIIGNLDSKIISYKTILSIINKKLYIKFDVISRGQLIERAIRMKMIPLII